MLANIRVRPRFRLLSFAAAGTAAGLMLTTPALTAQEPRDWRDDEVPAHVAIVDGQATLETDGLVEPLEENTVLLAGDRLRTDSGRVEILYGDGTVLDIDRFSAVDVMADSLLRLVDGRVRITVARSATLEYRVDGAGGSAILRSAGEYRISSGDPRRGTPQMEVVVYRGTAELRNSVGATLVRAGTYAVAAPGAAPSLPYPVNSAAWDEFDAWVYDLRDSRPGSRSGYLPASLTYYDSTLETAGSWSYEDTYGPVWYPHVAADWYPYSHGSWSVAGRFGWVWVGAERWHWPTHHYGRWGHHGGRWFWIPGHVWSPAWVTWASTPDYIGWSPLGFDNRPFVSITTVIHTGPRWGWSFVHADNWRRRVSVTNHVVSHDRFRDADWGRFRERRTGPAYVNARGDVIEPDGRPAITGRAVPRRSVLDDRSARPDSTAPPRRIGPVSQATRRAASPQGQPTRDLGSSSTSPSARPRIIERSSAGQYTSRSTGATPTSRSSRVPSRVDRSATAEPTGRAVSRRPEAAATPPPGRVIRSAPSAAPPPSRVIRSAPSAPPDRSPGDGARARSARESSTPPARQTPAARRVGSQPERSSGSAPASRAAAPPSRSAPPAGRAGGGGGGGGGGRPAPAGRAGGGSARPRGGGQQGP